MNEYQEIFNELVQLLLEADSSDTTQTTSLIKQFFGIRYSDYYVAGSNNNKEFLFDVSVMSCNPLEVHENTHTEYKIYLAAESELGGKSASSSKKVEQNTIEDFLKLICANTERKVMIAIYSIPSGHEEQPTLELKIQKLISINNKSNNEADILVIFIKGDHFLGSSRQVKIVTPMVIHGYILKKNKNYHELNNS